MAGKGEQWWTVRAKAQQPLLKTKNIQNYMPILAQIADEFIERFVDLYLKKKISWIDKWVDIFKIAQDSNDSAGK